MTNIEDGIQFGVEAELQEKKKKVAEKGWMRSALSELSIRVGPVPSRVS